jgi:diguanylate cyclase (GGDEF)-like protein
LDPLSLHIDILTMLLCLGLGSILLSILLHFHHDQTTSRTTLNLWKYGQLMKGIGSLGIVLVLILDLVNLYIFFDLLVFLGFALEFAAYRDYAGYSQAGQLPCLLLAILSFIHLGGFLLPADSQMQYWTAIATITFSIFTAANSIALRHGYPLHQVPSPMLRILVATNAIHAFFMAVCVVGIFVIPAHDLLTSVITNELMFILSFIFLIFNGFAFLLLLKEESDQKLIEIAIRDPLTGLYNRRFFDEQINRELNRVQHSQLVFALVLIDIDHFKGINDVYGHQAGDAALIHFSDFLKNRLRRSDTLARVGGEEFAILLPNTTAENAMLRMAELLAELTQASFYHQGKALFLSCSGGITDSTMGDSADLLLRQVDQALYHSKNNGRNCVTQFREMRRAEH